VRPSIVIPAYNAARTLQRTLAACKRQRWQGKPVEIVVVDDGSTDRTAKIPERAGARCMQQQNAGPAAARNTGWRAAQGDVICFTDSDCIPPADWVSRLLTVLEAEGASGVGGSYDIANPGSVIAACIHDEITYRHARMSGSVPFLGTFNVCFRCQALEEIGGFDESFPTASAEDNDLSYRLTEGGHELVFEPTIKVQHRHPERLWQFLGQQFWRAYWRIKLYRKHPHMMRGDRYTNLADAITVPTFLLLTGLAPFAWLPCVGWVAGALTLLGLALQLPAARHALRSGHRATALVAPGLFFLRGFAWAWGAVWGLLAFWLHGRRKKFKDRDHSGAREGRGPAGETGR